MARPAWISLAAVVVTCAVGLAGCGGGGGGSTQTYTVPSAAMEPTIPANSKVDVDLDAYKSADPEINDIVVFNPPKGTEDFRHQCGDPRTGASGSSGASCDAPIPVRSDLKFIKRIVAGPGTRLALRTGTRW